MASTSLGRPTSTSGGGQEAGGNSEGGLRRSTSSSVVGQAGEVVRAKDGNEAPATTSPLDRLPDELISLILSFCMSDHPTLVPFASYLIDKRIARVAHSVWLSHPVSDKHQQIPFFQQLIRQTDLAKRVLSFEVWVSRSAHPCQYEATMIGLFTNLTTLTLRALGETGDEDVFFPDEAVVPLPMFATDMLRSLPRLVDLRLDFDSEWRLEDMSFNIATCLPRLRRLTVASLGKCDAAQLLRPPPNSLDHLEIDVDTAEELYQVIPWRGLRSFEANLPADRALVFLDMALQGLQEAVRAASPVNVPLRRFKLRNLVFGAHPRLATVLPPITPEQLLSTLSLTNVASLSLCVGHEIVEAEKAPAVPSLEVLHLSTSQYNMHKPENFSSLTHLITLFPSLHTLTLHRFSFHDPTNPYAAARTHPANDREFLKLHPSLKEFLVFLRDRTKVRRFDWEPEGRGRWRTRSIRVRTEGGKESWRMEPYTEKTARGKVK